MDLHKQLYGKDPYEIDSPPGGGLKLWPAFEQPTLRDQFAMAALQGLLAHYGSYGGGGDSSIDVGLIAVAYEYADRMLKAREVGDE